MKLQEIQDRYTSLFQSALDADEQAAALQRRGDYQAAADGFSKASALYAQAAAALLDAGENSTASERMDIEKSVDRLIQVSRELKEHAAKLRARQPNASSSPSLPAQEEEETVFTAAAVPHVSFDDVAGLDDAKQLVMDEIIHPILYKDLYQRFHVESNGGLLLFGPPGGGKTMMARAVASQANMAFFSVRCSDIVGKYFGEAEKHVQALFNAARQEKNAVIFLDEAEALACRRGGHSTVMNRLVPELLSQMDGFERFDGHIIVIFATNRPYDLDPAFLRPGRLPNHCYIPLPDAKVRRAFLTKLIENRPCEGTIDIDSLVQKTERFSCADLANLVKRACMYPINRTIAQEHSEASVLQEFLTQKDLEKALSTLHPSVEPEEIDRLLKWMRKMGITLLEAA